MVFSVPAENVIILLFSKNGMEMKRNYQLVHFDVNSNVDRYCKSSFVVFF